MEDETFFKNYLCNKTKKRIFAINLNTYYSQTTTRINVADTGQVLTTRKGGTIDGNKAKQGQIQFGEIPEEG